MTLPNVNTPLTAVVQLDLPNPPSPLTRPDLFLSIDKVDSGYKLVLIVRREINDVYSELPRVIALEVDSVPINARDLDPCFGNLFTRTVPEDALKNGKSLSVCLKSCPLSGKLRAELELPANKCVVVTPRNATFGIVCPPTGPADALPVCPVKAIFWNDADLPEHVWLTSESPLVKGPNIPPPYVRDPAHLTVLDPDEGVWEFDLFAIADQGGQRQFSLNGDTSLTCEWKSGGFRFEFNPNLSATAPVVLSLIFAFEKGGTQKLGFGFGKAVISFFNEDFPSPQKSDFEKVQIRYFWHSPTTPDRLFPSFLCPGVPQIGIAAIRATIELALSDDAKDLLKREVCEWVQRLVDEVPVDAYFSFVNLVRACSPAFGFGAIHEFLGTFNPKNYFPAVFDGILADDKTTDKPFCIAYTSVVKNPAIEATPYFNPSVSTDGLHVTSPIPVILKQRTQ
jgi:hypothetical protein